MGVGGGAGRAAGVAAGVGCDPCKRVEKKSWASWSSFWEVDGLGSATKLRAGVFSTGAAAFAGARRRLVMLSAPPASAAKKSFASAASFWDVVGDGAVALGDGVPRRALRRSIVRYQRRPLHAVTAVYVNGESLAGVNAQRSVLNQSKVQQGGARGSQWPTTAKTKANHFLRGLNPRAILHLAKS